MEPRYLPSPLEFRSATPYRRAMPGYWWVNHKQTFRQEIDGEYLWSPKRSKNGARNEFYTNMLRAVPGDLVISYADGLIRFVGRVTDYAFTAPKPPEFGQTGSNWSQEGWLLPVFWTPVRTPVRPKDILPAIASFLPKRYSPFNAATGRGNQGAYLAHIPEDLFEAALSSDLLDRERLARGGANRLTYEIVKERLEDLVERQIVADPDLEETTKKTMIDARRGQGKFRKNVQAHERKCRLTGITNPALLNASHIKPWRLCGSAQERIDGMNGLMLTPDADRLFDRGFITFEADGRVLVSQRIATDDLRRLGLEHILWQRFGTSEAPAVWRTDAFLPAQMDYLGYHREQIFTA